MVSISSISSSLKTVYQYGKRVLNVAPELAFGTASEAMGTAMKQTSGSVFTKAEAGWRALEKAGSGSFFKGFFNNCKNFFPDIAKAYKAASGSGVKAGLKGVFKNLGSKMPFIMSASWILMEIPNIWKATKEQGIFQGVKEVLKFGARMTTAGLGSAIGAASPIPGGSLIGWMAGEWLASKIVGKSYSEQQAEKEEALKEQAQQTQQMPQQETTFNPYWLNPGFGTQTQQTASANNMTNPYANMYNQYKMQSLPYADDIMMKQMPFNVVA